MIAVQNNVAPTIGEYWDGQGGFYGGQVRVGDNVLAVVWAPEAEGEVIGKYLDCYLNVPGAVSLSDSMANTLAMAEAGSVLAQKALATNIGGHTDWCVPARDVLEMGYRYLKPTTEENSCCRLDGENLNSVPVGSRYAKTNPAQSSVEAFQEGNAEAFEDGWYISSTQASVNNAFYQYFGNGFLYLSGKYGEGNCRFVRLVLIA
jgi:hypothetical protein